MYQANDQGKGVIKDIDFFVERYKQICAQAAQEEPVPPEKEVGKRGKLKNSKGRNLLNRHIVHRESVLVFGLKPQNPFTNNLAERDIRCIKVKQRVSTHWRTLNGAETYARIQSCLKTFRKQSMHLLETLQNVYQGIMPNFQV